MLSSAPRMAPPSSSATSPRLKTLKLGKLDTLNASVTLCRQRQQEGHVSAGTIILQSAAMCQRDTGLPRQQISAGGRPPQPSYLELVDVHAREHSRGEPAAQLLEERRDLHARLAPRGPELHHQLASA